LLSTVVQVLGAARSIPELPKPGSDRATNLGQTLRAEQKKGDEEHDEEVRRTEYVHPPRIAEHLLM
jgi:hypothetical protein